MTVPVHVTPEADDELNAAYRWYEDVRPGLGERFRREFLSQLAKVQDNPAAWPRFLHGGQAIKIGRFPYKIVYTATQTSVTVWAAFHTSRNPKILKDRLKRGW